MNGEAGHSRLRDGVTTIGAVWLALVLAGLSIAWLSASWLAAVISFTIYVLLLGLYAFGTVPGRRSSLGAYLLAGVLYPFMTIALVILVAALETPERVSTVILVVGIGLRVGFERVGGPDTPIDYYLPLWAFNVLVPIILVVLAREFRSDATDRSGEEDPVP